MALGRRMRFIKTVSLEFVLFLLVVVHCKDPPVLLGTVKPEYRVKEGETVKLRCKFSGINDSVDNRTLTAWQNPKGDIITDNYERFKMRLGRYLKIRRVKLKDQGKYVCVAYNHFGQVKEEIQLVVQASNSSIIRPLPITKPTPTALSTQARYSLAVSTTKRPPRRCNIRPSKIPLIDDYPPKFRNPSKNRNRFLEFVEGQQIKLKCHAQGARPMNVTWLKNNKPLSKADRRHLKSKGWVLNFRRLTLNDAGTYTCTVRNAFCSIQRTFVVKVVEFGRPILQELEPKILENVLKNVTATVGEDVTFVCSALSKSHPEFHFLKWKSSKNVSNGSDPFEFVDFSKSKFREIREIARQHKGQRQVYTHRLIVRNVTLADEAKYTCVVGNSAGYVSEHAFLTVLSQEALQSDEPYAEGGIGVEQSSMTKPPKKSPRTQSDKEILVEEIPLAALIGVPIAVLILLIGTIVWCYFMTRKHHSPQHRKDENNGTLPQDQKKDLPAKISVPGKEETRNVSFNVYVDHPNDRAKTRLTEKQSGTHVKCTSQHVKCASQHVKCDSQHGKCESQRGKCARERDPPLDGLIIHNEPPRTHSNRTNHRKRHEREELEFNDSSGCEIKCSGV